MFKFKQHQRQESDFGISDNKDDLIKKLNEELSLHRSKLEQSIKENSNKMDTIKNIFGLDIDISKIMSRSMEKGKYLLISFRLKKLQLIKRSININNIHKIYD
jgi:hypothetical protein